MAATIVLAAHPDDETIGCGGILAHLSSVGVVFLTDGAPFDRRFYPAGLTVEREVYADIRRGEATHALAAAAIPSTRISWLESVDQEACADLPRLTRAFAKVIATERPELVFVHAYEGGHPDHDAASFVAQKALALLRRSGTRLPALLEMTGYHGGNGCFQAGHFLQTAACNEMPPPLVTQKPEELPLLLSRLRSHAAGQEVHFVLREEDRSRKADMFACYASQRDTLAAFGLGREIFRLASAPDFTRAPHDGSLYYEQLGWPLSASSWRTLARRAEESLGLAATSGRDKQGRNRQGRDRQGRNRQGRDRQGSDGAESDGAGSDGAESDGAGSDGAESDGAESDGAGSDGAGNDGETRR